MKTAFGKIHFLYVLAAFLGCCLLPLFPAGAAFSADACSSLDFMTFRLGKAPRVVLVVGGIQGDEPGGFSAATLLATRYEIKKGELWVVPNLNFPSIIRRSRGLFGDMNRKFASIDENDPEYGAVRRIQELVSRPEVALVLNLHDGSGYYRPKWEDKLKNPKRWGQSIIIDQENLSAGAFMGALGEEARAAAARANAELKRPELAIHVKNTNTAAGDREMEKSLSYYAARRDKAAFGIEASKEFPVEMRVWSHLLIVEAFLRMAGIEFSRDFDLSCAGVRLALRDNLGISFAGNRIFLPLEDARPTINYLPLPRGAGGPIPSKPIMAVLPCGRKDAELCIHYGNRKVALIKPDWREMEESLDAMRVIVDGEEKLAPFGHIIDVDREAVIKSTPGFRVNAIGYDEGRGDESGKRLRREDFEPRFSIDRSARIFRVETYKDQKFVGMFLLRFAQDRRKKQAPPILPDSPGKESLLGF